MPVELVNRSAVSSVAGDSTKLRAQNSKKNNYNQAKIDRHLAYIDNKIGEYTRALAEHDGDNHQAIRDEIKKQKKRKHQYKEIEKQLKESGETQVSPSDPECRQYSEPTEPGTRNITG